MTHRVGSNASNTLDPRAKEFYCHTLGVFEQAQLKALIGGAYALERYTGIERHTKDLDVFVRAEDFSRTLAALDDAGFRTETPFPHWLGKAFHGEYFVDVIYSSGNGVACVDDQWFEYATADHVFDVPVLLCPPEEMIWSKSFIQERERFDGSDIAHLLRAHGDRLNWQRLLRRFGPHWQVLLSHLILFGYIYPSEREQVPVWVLGELMRRHEDAVSAPPSERVCRGTLLSRQQYLPDIERWGYRDARTRPDNPMSDTEIAIWTAGIAKDGSI
jgi:hypothetical protein